MKYLQKHEKNATEEKYDSDFISGKRILRHFKQQKITSISTYMAINNKLEERNRNMDIFFFKDKQH